MPERPYLTPESESEVLSHQRGCLTFVTAPSSWDTTSAFFSFFSFFSFLSLPISYRVHAGNPSAIGRKKCSCRRPRPKELLEQSVNFAEILRVQSNPKSSTVLTNMNGIIGMSRGSHFVRFYKKSFLMDPWAHLPTAPTSVTHAPPPKVRLMRPPSPLRHQTEVAPPHELPARVRQQIEYYFSSENLAHDVYLRQQLDPDGWVSLGMIAGFNRVRQLTTDLCVIRSALAASSSLEVSHGGDGVRAVQRDEAAQRGGVRAARKGRAGGGQRGGAVRVEEHPGGVSGTGGGG